jgi:hypothetical protein
VAKLTLTYGPSVDPVDLSSAAVQFDFNASVMHPGRLTYHPGEPIHVVIELIERHLVDRVKTAVAKCLNAGPLLTELYEADTAYSYVNHAALAVNAESGPAEGE